MCLSSGGNAVPTRHLLLVTLHRYQSGMRGGIPSPIQESHLFRVTNTRCRIGTAFSPDYGHIGVVARNMQRKAINKLKKFVHQVGPIYKITRLYKEKR